MNNEKPSTLFKFKQNCITNINCGMRHAAMISKEGELFMIGSNDCGQLGVGESTQNEDLKVSDIPLLIHSLFFKGLIVDNVACGFSHTIATTKNGKVFSWGYGKFGALGLGSFENKFSPSEVVFFNQAYQSSQQIPII
jgi:alpha-tubulin suppressor-like RCC1 family protein